MNNVSKTKREPLRRHTEPTLRIVLTMTTKRIIGLGKATTRCEATPATGIDHDQRVAKANVGAMLGALQLPLRGMHPGKALRGPQKPGV